LLGVGYVTGTDIILHTTMSILSHGLIFCQFWETTKTHPDVTLTTITADMGSANRATWKKLGVVWAVKT